MMTSTMQICISALRKRFVFFSELENELAKGLADKISSATSLR